MFILSQTGELVNLSFVSKIFVSSGADGGASVVAQVPVPTGAEKPQIHFITLATYKDQKEAHSYIEDLAGVVSAPRPGATVDFFEGVSE